MGRGWAGSRTPLPAIVPGRTADDPLTEFPERMSAELERWLLSAELDGIYRLPNGVEVALCPLERVTPGFVRFPLSRPWRRGAPATTNYVMALDGSITKLRRLDATHVESSEMPFGPADLVPTGTVADCCYSCGAVSFTALHWSDHDETCGRP